MTIATTLAALKDRDRSNQSKTTEDGDAKATTASANKIDLPVALLMARSDIKSVSELTGKTIAIESRYSAYNRSVRAAIVEAGAPEVQLSEDQATAINRLVSGEVPAAVLALVSAEAAENFPEIAGFRIFHVPLSPRFLWDAQ
jgi:ABC-type amino acid transport substrate-binding protein